MKAFEIMEVAKSLGRLNDLLGAKSTISALLAELNNHKREEARYDSYHNADRYFASWPKSRPFPLNTNPTHCSGN